MWFETILRIQKLLNLSAVSSTLVVLLNTVTARIFLLSNNYVFHIITHIHLHSFTLVSRHNQIFIIHYYHKLSTCAVLCIILIQGHQSDVDTGYYTCMCPCISLSVIFQKHLLTDLIHHILYTTSSGQVFSDWPFHSANECILYVNIFCFAGWPLAGI